MTNYTLPITAGAYTYSGSSQNLEKNNHDMHVESGVYSVIKPPHHVKLIHRTAEEQAKEDARFARWAENTPGRTNRVRV